MTPRHYAELLFTLTRSKTSEAKIVEQFLAILKSRGHEALLPRIIREYERVAEREERREGVVMRVAKKGEGKKYTKEVKEILSQLAIDTEPQEVVDEALVSGYSLESADFRYDASARRSLISLFETLSA